MKSGSRITQARLDAGLSADELASRIGKSRATIYRYESDDIDIPLSIIKKIADVCNVNPAYLMGWSDSSEPLLSAAQFREIIKSAPVSLSDEEHYLVTLYRNATDAAREIAVETLQHHQKSADSAKTAT